MSAFRNISNSHIKKANTVQPLFFSQTKKSAFPILFPLHQGTTEVLDLFRAATPLQGPPQCISRSTNIVCGGGRGDIVSTKSNAIWQRPMSQNRLRIPGFKRYTILHLLTHQSPSWGIRRAKKLGKGMLGFLPFFLPVVGWAGVGWQKKTCLPLHQKKLYLFLPAEANYESLKLYRTGT